jgi:hypothetical protein
MFRSQISMLVLMAHSFVDVSEQAHQASGHLEAELGEGVVVNHDDATITLPISTFIEVAQPADFELPAAPDGFEWQVLPADASAPNGVVSTFDISDGHVQSFPRPTGPSKIYFVQTDVPAQPAA